MFSHSSCKCFFIYLLLTLFHTHSHMHLQWDEGLLTMSKGETARLEIEPEWAYGKKGLPDSKYPFIALKCFFLNTFTNLPIIKAAPILLLAHSYKFTA